MAYQIIEQPTNPPEFFKAYIDTTATHGASADASDAHTASGSESDAPDTGGEKAAAAASTLDASQKTKLDAYFVTVLIPKFKQVEDADRVNSIARDKVAAYNGYYIDSDKGQLPSGYFVGRTTSVNEAEAVDKASFDEAHHANKTLKGRVQNCMEQINKALEGFGQQQTRHSYANSAAGYSPIELFTPPNGTCSSIGSGIKAAPSATLGAVKSTPAAIMGIPSSVKSSAEGVRDYICTLPGIRSFVGQAS